MVEVLHVAIPVYNRVKAFKRLLKSLAYTRQPPNLTIELHFSIDDSPEQKRIQQLIADFEWPFGNKYSYTREQHAGLNYNLLRCGRLALEYGHIVILEDDLFVAPEIWQGCQQLLAHACNAQIGGLGLYSYIRTDHQWPFYPLEAPYYLQRVCTWGQIFTAYQWEQFEHWLAKRFAATGQSIDQNMRKQKQKTWGTTFTEFLKDTGRYFIYASARSLTTNFGTLGTNVRRPTEENAFQTPLQLTAQSLTVPHLEETTAVYDAYFELLPDRMKRLNPHLEPYDFAVDLYGTKPLSAIEKPFLLSCKKATKPEMTFGRNLKPHELNIAYEIEGRDFFLAKKENFQESPIDQWRRELRTHYYHYPDVSIKHALKMKIFEIFNRLL